MRPDGPHGGRGRNRWAAPVDEPGMLRLFFAVPVPDDARAKVGELIDEVQSSVGDGTARIRWVRVDGLHLTLRFLGPTPEDRQAPLEIFENRVLCFEKLARLERVRDFQYKLFPGLIR